MAEYSIAIIPGDGIGREVTPPAFAIARKAAEAIGASLRSTSYDWGSDYYRQHGRMMPADALDTLRPCHAILLGRSGSPGCSG